LFIAAEFLNAKKLQTLQGANQNFSFHSSDSDLLGRMMSRPRFLAKIPEAVHKLFFDSCSGPDESGLPQKFLVMN
jgi:hypothetical protein